MIKDLMNSLHLKQGNRLRKAEKRKKRTNVEYPTQLNKKKG